MALSITRSSLIADYGISQCPLAPSSHPPPTTPSAVYRVQTHDVGPGEARSISASVSDCCGPYVFRLCLAAFLRPQPPTAELPWPCPVDHDRARCSCHGLSHWVVDQSSKSRHVPTALPRMLSVPSGSISCNACFWSPMNLNTNRAFRSHCSSCRSHRDTILHLPTTRCHAF